MRLIDADKLIEGLYVDRPKDIALYIAEQPIIEPERPTGRWLGNYAPYTCSNPKCGKTSETKTPYCRYCGTDMRLE